MADNKPHDPYCCERCDRKFLDVVELLDINPPEAKRQTYLFEGRCVIHGRFRGLWDIDQAVVSYRSLEAPAQA